MTLLSLKDRAKRIYDSLAQLAFSSHLFPINYPINFDYFTFTHFKLFTFLHIKTTFIVIKSVYHARICIKNILDFIHSVNILSTIPEN